MLGVLSEFSECTTPFTPGRDFIQFRDAQELREMLRRYLSNPDARKRIAASGYAVSQQYTWDEVARILLHRIQGGRRKTFGLHLSGWLNSLCRASLFYACDWLSQLKKMSLGAGV